MDPVVTARVPESVKNRGNEILHEMGSTTSELINAAYEYVIRTKQLPKAVETPEAGMRRPSVEQAAQLSSFMSAVHVPVPSEWDAATYEELLASAMKEKICGSSLTPTCCSTSSPKGSRSSMSPNGGLATTAPNGRWPRRLRA